MSRGCASFIQEAVAFTEPLQPAATVRAWVVFTGQTDLTFLRPLKPGFRHCFLLLNDGENWIAYEPLANRTEIFVLPTPPDFDLPSWLSGQELLLIEARINRELKARPTLELMSCVASIKRVLGIQCAFIFTPYQLYRYLQKEISTWAV